MNYAMELDISHEASHDEVLQFAKENNCEAELINEFGPAGGNPLYKFTSDTFDSLQELAEEMLGIDITDKIYTEEGMTF